MINKIAFVLLIIFYFQSSFSQKKFRAIDLKAKSVKSYRNPEDLSHKLTSGYNSEIEKVHAIFYWITENIRYDTEEFHKDSANSYYTLLKLLLVNTNQEFNKELYNKMIIDTVLAKKSAICDGYARLFRTLCHYSNIKSEIITGMGKNSIQDINNFNSDHAWNSVFIKDKWYLLDACWASGYCDSGTVTFTKNYEDFYLLSNPKHFSYSHFPDSKKYFFYENPISKQQFISTPLVLPNFFKLGFDNFTPLSGVITVKKNDKIQLTIAKLNTEKNQKFMSNSSLYFKKVETKYYFEETINDLSTTSMDIFYDNKAILIYKIKHY